MYDYTELYHNCDKILDYIVGRGGRITRSDLNSILPKDSFTHVALQHLIEDKCIKEFPDGSRNYDIITNGTRIQGNGGYKEEFNRLRLSDELKSTINQSILDTNTSVKDTNTAAQKLYNETLPNSLKSQNTATNISIGVGIVSLIFIGLSTYYQATDRTPIEVQKLKEEVKETQKKLQTIQSSLEGINSSIQTTKIDTVFVKQR